MRTAIRHVVWDWNGTLLDDNHAVLAAVNAVCAEHGRGPFTLDQWRATFRRPLIDCYGELLGRTLSTQDWADLDRCYHDSYHALLHSCALAHGVADTLTAWRTRGRTQSLLSMWTHHRLTELITTMGLLDHFTKIDGLRHDPGGGSKSSHLLAHLREQELDPADVVLIGDIVDDSDAAEAAGTRCVLVTTGMGSPESLRRTGRPVVDSVAEAIRLISD